MYGAWYRGHPLRIMAMISIEGDLCNISAQVHEAVATPSHSCLVTLAEETVKLQIYLPRVLGTFGHYGFQT